MTQHQQPHHTFLFSQLMDASAAILAVWKAQTRRGKKSYSMGFTDALKFIYAARALSEDSGVSPGESSEHAIAFVRLVAETVGLEGTSPPAYLDHTRGKGFGVQNKK